jgi:hypothetical protein
LFEGRLPRKMEETQEEDDLKGQVDFDSALEEIGAFGKYQKILYYSVCTPIILTTSLGLSVIFSAAVPKYRCFIPGCDNVTEPSYSAAFNEGFANFSIPQDKNGIFESCSHFKKNDSDFVTMKSQCSKDQFDPKMVQNCTEVRFIFLATKKFEPVQQLLLFDLLTNCNVQFAAI